MAELCSSRSDVLAALVLQLRHFLRADQVIERASLAPYTTWRVGGPADVLCVIDRVEHLMAATRLAACLGVAWRVLGRGSNVLVRDGGVAGLVIVNRTRGVQITGTYVLAESGLLLSTLAQRTATAGLAGLEWSAGIPGSVGGSVVSNAGAHGGQVADTLQRVQLFEPGAQCEAARTGSGKADMVVVDDQREGSWVDAASLHLAYRHSRLRVHAAPEVVVLRAEFLLQPDDPAVIRARIDAQRRQRRSSQPVAQSSAGSVFKNPPGESAARLIETAGLKVVQVGGAQVSSLHANFMVTRPGATARDLLALIVLVQQQVLERHGIALTLEVQPIGRETTANT